MNTQQFGQLVAIPQSVKQRLRALTQSFPEENVETSHERAIAAWVVGRYLRRFGFVCEIEESSAWNPTLSLLTDFAELEISSMEGDELGTVECLILPAEAKELQIPETVVGDRLAYIAVEVNAEQSWGTIVGFVPALRLKSPKLKIKREKLLSRERLIDLLADVESLVEKSRLSELQGYWERHGIWSEEQRLAAIAQLESALLLQSKELRQVETAAQQLERLIAESAGTAVNRELAFKEEDDSLGGDRLELREILKRLFQSLREDLD
ncbi:MAG: DUF1822 family protein [Phormidium sp. BM_Day4_Bin.17]|nr:DUF1822 family protein [Phormidium sp. BM_Day4_Bin.17]UCJ10690.1 MAG: DUF1822 family protein [Phormidium sp. PBR-2020]